MPIIQIATAIELGRDKVNTIEQDLCAVIGSTLSKPREYIMVVFQHAHVEFGNSDDPAAFVDVRSIGGLTPVSNARLAREISAVIEKHLDVPAARIYLTFTDVPATHWGWNGTTFA